MARMSLTCKCGWTFFLPGTTPGHEANCPSCGEGVPIPGRKPGRDVPMTAGAIAAQVQRKQSTMRMLIGGAVVAVVGGAVVLGLTLGGKSAPDDDLKAPGQDNPFASSRSRPGKVVQPAPIPEAPPVPQDHPPLYNAAQILEFRHNVFANVWLLNMAAILSECARYRGLTNDWGQLQADIALYDGKIKQNLAELAKVGEKVVLEPYLAQGDQIIRFAQRDLTAMKSSEAGQVIAFWASNWTPGAALEKVDFIRAGTPVTMYLQFPENSTELLQLLRHPAIQPDNPAEVPPGNVSPVMTPLPPELFKDVHDRFSALPPGYRSLLTPEHRQRLEDLSVTRKGTPEDLEWIRTWILTETLPAFQREAEMIRAQIPALESKMKEGAPVDTILRKNGSKLDGKILDETATTVKMSYRGITATIQKDEISEIKRGAGAASEFMPKYADAKGSVDKLVAVMVWCAEKNLKLEKECVAYNILTLDASHAKARAAVGLAPPVIGSPGPKTPSADDPSKLGAGVQKAIAIIANDVLSRNQALSDVITQMRRRTESLATTAPLPVTPEKSMKGLSFIQNPLTFEASKLPATALAELGGWWSGLTLEERRQFANYFGFWCAVTRGRM